MRRNRRSMDGLAGRVAVAVVLAVALAGCGGESTGPSGEVRLALPGASSLVFEGAAAASPDQDRLAELVEATVVDARQVIPLDGITVRVRHGSSQNVIPQLGFGGRADAGTVTLTIDPGSSAWRASLETEFPRVLLHELHHVARFRAVGFADNLLEAAVSEGLADQFTLERAGGDPPIWATALTPEEVDTWLTQAGAEWLASGYDHDAWFFGVGPRSIPFWTGYTLGFEITRRFLEANPGARASTLYDEPATSFIPAG